MYNNYMKEIEKIKAMNKIDIAFVPVDPRLGVNTLEGVEIFYKNLEPKVIVPMHFSDNYSFMDKLKNMFSNIENVSIIEIKEDMSVILK